MRSCATLLTAYGESGRRGLASVVGVSGAWTSPYSSLEPTTRRRGAIRSARSASSRFTWQITFVCSELAGAWNDTWTKLCAARWKTQSGRASAAPLPDSGDVLEPAPPADRAPDLRARPERVLGQVAADEARDAGDQDAHSVSLAGRGRIASLYYKRRHTESPPRSQTRSKSGGASASDSAG